MVPFLTDYGYSPSQSGFVMSAIFALAIVGQPLLGSVSDRMSTPRWIVACAMIVAGGLSLLLPGGVAVYGLVVVVALLYSLSAGSLPAVLDAWIMARRRRNPGLSYGVSRGFGSLGFAVGAYVFGLAGERMGVSIVFVIYAFLAAGVALLAVLMPRPPATEAVASEGSGGSRGDADGPGHGRGGQASAAPAPDRRAQKGSEPHLVQGLKAVVKNGPYLALLLATFITFVGFRAAMTFLPLLLEAVGGTVADVGSSYSIAAISEVPLLFLSGIIIRRIRGPRLIAAVLLLMAGRIFVYSLMRSPEAVLILQATHGVTFGIFLAAVVDYIDQIAPPDHRSLFQAIAPSIFFGLGSVVGSWVGGITIEAVSLEFLYQASGVLALAGGVVVIISGRLRRHRELVTRPQRDASAP